MAGDIGTNTPKFVHPRWGPRLDPIQTGLCKFGWVWSSLIYLEGPEYPEYVMHIFHLKYSGTPEIGNMLGNSLPVGFAQHNRKLPNVFGLSTIRNMLCILVLHKVFL